MNKSYTFQDLLDIMKRLRGENGCPWDREQTHDSLKKYILEEAYEVVDAIDQNSRPKQAEELGDVLLQIVFQSQIASEEKSFTIDDVINSICQKLIHRHPHVFGDMSINEAERVEKTWQEIKKQEKGMESYSQILKDIPKGMSALMRSYKVQKKAAEVGFEWESIEDAIGKVKEELQETIVEYEANNQEKTYEEIGDLIYSVVNLSRMLKVEPETALNSTITKFINRFELMEKNAEKTGKKLEEMSLAEMDKLWNEAKIALKYAK